jgi:hypothetical protein
MQWIDLRWFNPKIYWPCDESILQWIDFEMNHPCDESIHDKSTMWWIDQWWIDAEWIDSAMNWLCDEFTCDKSTYDESTQCWKNLAINQLWDESTNDKLPLRWIDSTVNSSLPKKNNIFTLKNWRIRKIYNASLTWFANCPLSKWKSNRSITSLNFRNTLLESS